jgi:hypothetical protein
MIRRAPWPAARPARPAAGRTWRLLPTTMKISQALARATASPRTTVSRRSPKSTVAD